MNHILHIDASGRKEGSYSRKLSAELVTRLVSQRPDAEVVYRDLAMGVEFVDEAWIGSSFTPANDRSSDQEVRLQGSDTLVQELQFADTIVIGTPIYNFSVPGSLKAWVDQVCRANLTFRYEPTGPIGLLEGKKAYVVVVSGGTEVQGEVDFATDYLVHVLGFIGIKDVTIISANQLMVDEGKALEQARSDIELAA